MGQLVRRSRLCSHFCSAARRSIYNDPYLPQLHKMRHYNYEHMKSVPLNPQSLASYDAVVIATNHSSHDYLSIVDNVKLVIEIRNARRCVMRHREKIALC